jgi:hypothetical protein
VLSSFQRASARFNHLDLLELDAFYIGEFETRNRFFRGIFDKDIWMTLRERYIDFAGAERDNVEYQISLLTALSRRKPFVNEPESYVKARLRPAVLFRLGAAGLPAADPVVEIAGGQDQTSYMRVRIEEDETYDVPCFPRNLEGCAGLRIDDGGDRIRVIGLKGEGLSTSVVEAGGGVRVEEAGEDLVSLTAAILDTLSLETAEVHFIRHAGDIRITEVLPAPHVAEFEDLTGEAISGRIAGRLLSRGGSV